MLTLTLVLLVAALAAAAVTTWLAFAQHALLATLVEEGRERAPGDDYAEAARVTRLLERPRAAYLELTAARTACRWMTLACLVGVGLESGRGLHLWLALAGAFVLFTLEEELPLRLVLRDPTGWGTALLPPAGMLVRFFRRLEPLFEAAYRVSRLFVRHRSGNEPPLSVEELTMMAASGGADLGLEERRILRGIFRSSGILVADIMTPRDRVAAIPVLLTVSQALDAFRARRHSRLPVFDSDLDHIVGVAHARDFLRPAFDPLGREASIRDILRDAYFVRQDRRIHELFDELRDSKVHLAVVVDRMGRTVGIVSLEDILEEIVGEIHDELEAEKVRG